MMKIMHVDDETDILEIAQLSLMMDGGFDVHSVSSAKDALIAIDSFKPDIFLLDVMMPETSGSQLAEILKQSPQTANTPIIFMTAATQEAKINQLMEIGAIGVVGKPFDPMTLAQQIRDIMTVNA